jgi:hypothetical protein
MPDVYPCPECGNDETEWATAAPNLRVCRPPRGCGFAWLRMERSTRRKNWLLSAHAAVPQGFAVS